MCSDTVIVPFDTNLKTRLYVDSSPVGTQATVAQEHMYENELVWRPSNHTSRAWTPTEANYGQIERESNGILTGMHVRFNDNVLIKQKKSTVKPPFDPNPYKVTDIKGNRVTMKREDGKKRVRDKKTNQGSKTKTIGNQTVLGEETEFCANSLCFL